jgi:hypothetical protein
MTKPNSVDVSAWSAFLAAAAERGTTPEALVQKAIAWFLAVHRYGVDGAKR